MARGNAVATPDGILTSRPGTYALGLHLPRTATIGVGALGKWDFPAGLYLYVGSAWGPGGLAARVGRHLRGNGPLRWHIDYLRAQSAPVAIWIAPEKRNECTWATALIEMSGIQIPVPRFGASDCTCPAHLIYAGATDPGSITLPDGIFCKIPSSAGIDPTVSH